MVSLLSLATIDVAQQLFPLLQYIIPEALPQSLMGLALASSGSMLEPAGISSVGHGGSFQQLLTETTSVAAPATKALRCSPNMCGQLLFLRSSESKNSLEYFLSPNGYTFLHCKFYFLLGSNMPQSRGVKI